MRWTLRGAVPEPEPRPDRGPSLTEIMLRRRRLDQQIFTFRAFERRLSRQLKDALAAQRADYARELSSRRVAVRTRLDEVLRRRHWIGLEEDRLRSGFAPAT